MSGPYPNIEKVYHQSIEPTIASMTESIEIDQQWRTLKHWLTELEQKTTGWRHQGRTNEEYQQWLENVAHLREFVEPIKNSTRQYQHQSSTNQRQKWLPAWSYSPEGYRWFQEAWTITAQSATNRANNTNLDAFWKPFEGLGFSDQLDNLMAYNQKDVNFNALTLSTPGYGMSSSNIFEILGLQQLETRLALLHQIAFDPKTDSKVRCTLLAQMNNDEDLRSIPCVCFKKTFDLRHEKNLDQPSLRAWLARVEKSQESAFKHQPFVQQYRYEKDPTRFWKECSQQGAMALKHWLPENDDRLGTWINEIVEHAVQTSEYAFFWALYRERLIKDELSVGVPTKAKGRRTLFWTDFISSQDTLPHNVSRILQDQILRTPQLRCEFWAQHLNEYGLQSILSPIAWDILREDIQDPTLAALFFKAMEQEDPEHPYSIGNVIRKRYPKSSAPENMNLSEEEKKCYTIVAMVDEFFHPNASEKESLLDTINAYRAVGIDSANQAILQWLKNRQFKLVDTTTFEWTSGIGSPR